MLLTAGNAANAVQLSTTGTGQVLLYPYYTVNEGNQTLMSLINTTSAVKALRVRFMESRNSKSVFEFNLYLASYDTWTGAVFSDQSNGPAKLISFDKTCTVPKIDSAASSTNNGLRNILAFQSSAYSGDNRDHPLQLELSLSSPTRTREGHIEVIEMGELTNGISPTQLADEANFNAAGNPNNCNRIIDAWNAGGAWAAGLSAAQTDIKLPSGGVYGHAEIIDVANGTNISYDATAIDQFYTDISAPGFLHSAPNSARPNLTDADNGEFAKVVTQIFNSDTNMIETVEERVPVGLPTPDAMSLILTKASIMNEFNTDPALAGASEWVLTFPTKRFYVDIGPPLFSATTALPPFGMNFRNNGRSCISVEASILDRDSRLIFSPPPSGVLPPHYTPSAEEYYANSPKICGSANVIAWNQSNALFGQISETQVGELFAPSKIFGAHAAPWIQVRENYTSLMKSGQIKLDFDRQIRFSGASLDPYDRIASLRGPTSGKAYLGLPIIGFWAANYVNAAAAPGMLANFSATHPYKFKQSIMN